MLGSRVSDNLPGPASPPGRAAGRPLKRLLAIAVVLSSAGCHKPEDQAAKARIFSPEEPPKFVTHATENLGADTLDTDGERIRRVFQMSAAEAAERLGPHQMSSHVEFTWTNGSQQVSLDEDHTLTFGSPGDFIARLDSGDKLSDTRQGMEIERLGGRVWARSRFGHFRERNRDRGAAERYREQVYGVMPTLYQLFQGRVALIKEGAADSASGRKAIKYAIALAQLGTTPDAEAGPHLPPLAFPKEGPDAHLKRELDFDAKRTAQTLEGRLLVDAETAVILDATIRGTLEAAGESGAKSQLQMSVSQHVSAVGKDPNLAPPKDALPDEGRPQGVAAALERFDLPRLSHNDGGAAEAEEADEP